MFRNFEYLIVFSSTPGVLPEQNDWYWIQPWKVNEIKAYKNRYFSKDRLEQLFFYHSLLLNASRMGYWCVTYDLYRSQMSNSCVILYMSHRSATYKSLMDRRQVSFKSQMSNRLVTCGLLHMSHRYVTCRLQMRHVWVTDGSLTDHSRVTQ